jgi:hypothetical protein
MQIRTIFSFVILSVVVAASARGATHFERDRVFLYQPDADLRARLESVEDLTAYIKRLQAAGTSFFASEQKPESLDVVVGVKPGKRVKIRFISSRRPTEDKELDALRRKLEAVRPCSVHGGPVVFALNWTIAGGKPTAKQKTKSPFPIPEEWRSAGKDLSVPDGIFGRVWPD